MVARTVASDVHSVWITSTSGTRCGGFQKCVPTTRSRCLRFLPISVEGMADELLARMVSGATSASSSAKICCLSGKFLRRGLEHELHAVGGIIHRPVNLDPLQRRRLADQIDNRLQPLRQRGAHLGRRLEQAHLVPAGREQIGDAVAHQAAADDADAAHPAVYPPSTYITWPVQKSEAGVSR